VTNAPVHPAPGRAKAVGWTVVFLIAGIVVTLVAGAAGFLFERAVPNPADPTSRDLIVQTMAGLFGFGLVTWVLGIRVLRLTPADLRWAPLSRAGRGFALGAVVGALPAVVALGLSVPLGHAQFLRDAGGPLDYLRQVGLTALILAPAALVEELIFRGVGQVVLARAFGRVPAILLLSVLFALAHLFNPNPTALGLLNIALAGVFLGIAFYAPGGIWTAWGAHLGWNATLAALDAPVSGLPLKIPWIDYQPGGPVWLTGGSFGPEGGLLASAALALATAAIWHWTWKEAA
jgi:membrane protease YdiL (CAAX protease family)